MSRGRKPGTRNVGAGAYVPSFSRLEAETLTNYACTYPTNEMSDAEFKAFGSAIDKIQKALLRRDTVNARKETDGSQDDRDS